MVEFTVICEAGDVDDPSTKLQTVNIPFVKVTPCYFKRTIFGLGPEVFVLLVKAGWGGSLAPVTHSPLD